MLCRILNAFLLISIGFRSETLKPKLIKGSSHALYGIRIGAGKDSNPGKFEKNQYMRVYAALIVL